MSKQREALELALEALNVSVFDFKDAWHGTTYAENKVQEIQAKASDAIREALAEQEQEQEPVAWLSIDSIGEHYLYFSKPLANDPAFPLYLAPTALTEPLTDEQISAIVQSMSAYTWDAHTLARAIERAHGIGEV